ncbi:polysaccharide biosynthesis/export family protein [Terrihabitans rhizophilus]|jgi:polysaccharide export outer membrane protein|nr:polysaccharide biosynthesis/export family protein [Terrihabitans sp. PJ23]
MPRLPFWLIIMPLILLSAANCAPPQTGVMAAPLPDAPYRLGSGDRLRIVVFDQTNLSGSFAVDAAGMITLPLLGTVPAEGKTPQELKAVLEQRLRKQFLREPNVSVEIEAYRPFFIFGEVAQSGQYAYIAGMTVEQAVAIAGGYTPRGRRGPVQLARRDGADVVRIEVPLTTLMRPGDTIFVQERWF